LICFPLPLPSRDWKKNPKSLFKNKINLKRLLRILFYFLNFLLEWASQKERFSNKLWHIIKTCGEEKPFIIWLLITTKNIKTNPRNLSILDAFKKTKKTQKQRILWQSSSICKKKRQQWEILHKKGTLTKKAAA